MRSFFVFLPALLPALLIVSCERVDLPSQMEDLSGWESVSHGMIQLGEKLDDPYTVENMTKALASLYPKSSFSIYGTDMYVRFLPRDDEQYAELESLGLDLIDHPLDYKIVREGDYYQDPSIPEGEPTWQYAVVPSSFTCPGGIVYEILERCYIPEHDEVTKTSCGVDWKAVERESFILTGNSDLLGSPDTRAGESVTPSGSIRIVDEKFSESIGVAGVKVSANCFVKFATGYTDEEGEFTLDKSFSTDVRYRIVFKNKKGFGIGFNLLLVPASISTLGKNPPSGIDVQIDASSDRKLFTRCVVNNAAYEYFSMCQDADCAISCPALNLRFWLFQGLSASSAVMLQQGAIIDSGLIKEFLGEYASLVKMFLPDITLGLRDCTSYEDVWSLTMHELAHASHFQKAGKSYWNDYIRYIIESFITSGWMLYGAGGGTGAGNCAIGEMWAYYMQSKMLRSHYGSFDTTLGTGYWFYPQIFLYMDERGMDADKIFKALSSDVASVDDLQTKFENLYPEYKSVISMAFNRYL